MGKKIFKTILCIVVVCIAALLVLKMLAEDGGSDKTMGQQVQMLEKEIHMNEIAADDFRPMFELKEYQGIDVSSNNKSIDWGKVKDAGIEFAMIRITTRNLNPDTYFEEHYNGAMENGIYAGGYKYGYATTPEEARKEAKSVLDALNGRELTFPIAYDIEDPSLENLSSEELNAVIDAFKEEVEAAGYEFMSYAKIEWLENVLDTDHFAEEDIWIANYKDQELGHGYAGGGKITIWQYSESGSVSGVSGNVDRNVAYKLYN